MSEAAGYRVGMDGERLNRRLVKVVFGFASLSFDAPLRAGTSDFADEAAEGGPAQFYAYLWAVITAWYGLAILAGLATAGLAYVGHVIGGTSGSYSGVVIGDGVAFFCVAGGVDATWRSLFVYAAKRRVRRRGTLDDRGRLEMRIARVRYPTLVAQGLVAIAAAVISALYLWGAG